MSCKVYITHPSAKSEEYIKDAFHLTDEQMKRFDMRWDDDKPDILFASEVILYDQSMMAKFRELYPKAGICVFFPGECMAPDLNVFDYAISVEGYDASNDRIYRVPPRRFYSDYIGKDHNSISRAEAPKYLKEKVGFCNFIYSNPNGHINRKNIFDTISKYKRVDSYGAYLNNMGLGESGGAGLTELIRGSADIKSRYKFTIAFENGIYPGYTTEKLYTSLEAGTVPVYWGNPRIDMDVNEKAIINCHNYKNFDEVLERIKQIDEDDDLWCEIVSEPWLAKEQLEREIKENKRLDDFLDRLFCGDLKSERRRPEGTWPETYQNFWLAKDAGSDKYRKYFNICSSFCKRLQSGKHLYDLLQPGIDSIVIYGMGDIGRILYDDFKASNSIDVPYCIDNRSEIDGIAVDCIKLSELKNKTKPDAVIVTVPTDFEEIKNSILNIFDTKVISVEELID